MFFWGGTVMSIKVKQILETGSVLISIFLIVILFAMFLPYISSSNVTIPFKMLFELSPFIVIVGLVAAVCKLRKRPVFIGLGFKKSQIAK